MTADIRNQILNHVQLTLMDHCDEEEDKILCITLGRFDH